MKLRKLFRFLRLLFVTKFVSNRGWVPKWQLAPDKGHFSLWNYRKVRDWMKMTQLHRTMTCSPLPKKHSTLSVKMRKKWSFLEKNIEDSSAFTTRLSGFQILNNPTLRFQNSSVYTKFYRLYTLLWSKFCWRAISKFLVKPQIYNYDLCNKSYFDNESNCYLQNKLKKETTSASDLNSNILFLSNESLEINEDLLTMR